MTIINPIYHQYFARLFEQVGHHKTTILLCMCLQYWKISTYKVMGDNNIWFTRSLDDLAEAMSISKSSLSRYLNILEEKGLIQRINKLGWDKESQSVKKRLYIRITDKLLLLVGHNKIESPLVSQPIHTAAEIPATPDISHSMAPIPTVALMNKEVAKIEATPQDALHTNQDASLPTDVDHLENVKMEFSIYKGSYSNTNTNNTVRQGDIVNNSIPTPKNPQPPETSRATPVFPIEQALNELLTPQLKNYIKGMLGNMQTQHGLKFSNPEQLFAEVVFSVLNKNDQMPGIEDPHHRVNIIAKLLREKRWLTPKGFYNHWDIGAKFKQSHANNNENHQRQKRQDIERAGRLFINADSNPADTQKGGTIHKSYEQAKHHAEQKNALRDIIINITTEERYLNQMQQQHTQKPSQLTQSVIDATLSKLATLQITKQRLEETLSMKNAA